MTESAYCTVTPAKVRMQYAQDVASWGCVTNTLYLVGWRIFTSLQSHIMTGTGKSWQLNRAAPLGNEAVGIMTRYPTQSYYPDTE